MRLVWLSLLLVFPLRAAIPGNEYVDVRACAQCHTKIDAAYRQNGMGRSMYKPAPANTVEDYRNHNEFTHTLSSTHYSMTERAGAYYQRRWQIGFDGKETNVEEMKIDYVIGSGNHARSYLHKTVSGGYIELPLSWYAEKNGYWAMSPGFDDSHPQTRRFASYECIFCHDAIPRIPAGHDAPGSDPVFAAGLPEGIDCQRCHGPGGKHVNMAKTAGAKQADIRASILNPARLSPALRMDLCMQCHLEPTSGELPALIRRFNRGPFSFVPGEPLTNFLLVFDHAPGTGHDDKFEIVNSSAYRLRKSQCFLKSGGALTCTTCHDPHSAQHGAEAVKRYSAACRQCHAASFDTALSAGRHPAVSECISCHMPRRRTEDVVHAVMTDHLIQRRPPPGDLLADLAERHAPDVREYRGEVVPYFPSLPRGGDVELYRAVAQVALKNNLEKGVLDLAREIARTQPREAEFYMVLGDALQNSGKPREAADAYEHAIRLRGDFPRGLISQAGALKASGQLARADAVLTRARQLAPGNAAAWFQSGALDYALGRIGGAVTKMEKAIALDPDLTGGRTGLAELLWRAGKIDVAEGHLRDALRVDPYDATAHDLIGRVLAGKGQAPEALFDFEKATHLRPGYAPHLYDYALELSSVSRLDEAQTSVEAALRADPDMAEAHALLAGLLAGKRQLPQAAREYSEAVRLKPDFARAHLDLARVLAAEGDMPGAIEHLRNAAAGSDPQVAQIAKEALQRVGQK
jgi:predicted CXXCH cytochrome family protein